MYESPISMIFGDIQHQMEEQNEGEILRVVWKCGVNVNKEELLKALKYDREQYEKGYRDAKAEQQWIPCSERMPEKNQVCIVTDETRRNAYEYRFCDETYDEEQGWTYLSHRIIAWMPLPEPYREGGS